MSITKEQIEKRKEQIKKDFDALVKQIEDQELKICLLYTSDAADE